MLQLVVTCAEVGSNEKIIVLYICETGIPFELGITVTIMLSVEIVSYTWTSVYC